MTRINYEGIDFMELENGEIAVLNDEFEEFPIKNYLYKEEDDGDNIYNINKYIKPFSVQFQWLTGHT